MELDGTKPQMPNKLLIEIKNYFKNNLCNGLECTKNACFC